MSFTPSSDLQSLFETALSEYQKKAGTNLVEHDLAIKLKGCQSTDTIIALLQEQAQAFHKFRRDDTLVTRMINRTVHILYTLSTGGVLAEGLGLSFPPAKAVFAGIGVLLAAVKDINASYDALVELFESIESFLRRLDIYTKIPLTMAMTEIVVKILVELLSTLALATQQVKQGRLKKFGKKLLGENDVESVLHRLDRLTQEEARTTAAQTLEIVHGLIRNINVIMDDGKASTDDIRRALVVMQQIASEINKAKRDKLQENFRRWLSPPDPSKNHNIACEAHHEGTAAWFVQGTTFAEWKEIGSLLWIHGKPGSGKSILCSTIIREIKLMREAGLASMAFFYFDFRDDQKQNLRGLLSSLVVQLCARSDRCSYILSRLYSAHDAGSLQPSDSALIECLQEMIKPSGQCTTYVIVDALDECPKTSGTPSAREKVLKVVKELVDLHHPNLRICITSRPEADIQIDLQSLASHTVSLHDEAGQVEDINNYISFFVNADSNTRRWRKEDRELVMNKLCQQADGMFRWVFCQLDFLRRCLPGRIRRALDELPGTLDETYARALQEIDEANWEYAHRLFQCVTVAFRPLRIEELAEFLAFDFDAGDFPTFVAGWRPENAEDAVLSTCSSLIAIVKVEGSESPVVQFSHFSVKEFLTSNRLARGRASRFFIPLEPAHLIVTQACLSVLLQLDHTIKTKLSNNSLPLSAYAARHWVDHAKFENVSLHTLDAMKNLFDPSEPHFQAWIRTHNMDGYADGTTSDLSGTPLYYAALCDFHNVAEWLVATHSQDVNARGGYFKTPLHAACAKGSFHATQTLLEHDADMTAKGNSDWHPLHYASGRGHLELSRLLLDHGAPVNAQNFIGRTPLLEPSRKGYLDVVWLLLERGADPNTWYNDEETPLYVALLGGHQKVVQLLLEHGGDVNAGNKTGQSLLHLASKWGDLEVAQVLLKNGANVHTRDEDGLTPLQVTSEDKMVQLLLQHGAKEIVTRFTVAA